MVAICMQSKKFKPFFDLCFKRRVREEEKRDSVREKTSILDVLINVEKRLAIFVPYKRKITLIDSAMAIFDVRKTDSFFSRFSTILTDLL